MDIVDVDHRALTVYGPEVLLSGLTAALDAFISERAAVSLAQRFFVLHDAASITRFYELTGSTSGAHWPLVVDLFDGRPCLASIWTGRNALEKIQRLKGATQPAKASLETIRGNFACDNPVCNLIHVSDSAELSVEEIAILERRSMAAGNRTVDPTGLPTSSPTCRHSSLWTFAATLCRIDPSVDFPTHDALSSAQASADLTIRSLQRIASERPDIERAIIAFLQGRHADLLAGLPAGFRMTAWERLMIECGCHSTPLWVDKLRVVEVGSCL